MAILGRGMEKCLGKREELAWEGITENDLGTTFGKNRGNNPPMKNDLKNAGKCKKEGRVFQKNVKTHSAWTP